jgi:amidase
MEAAIARARFRTCCNILFAFLSNPISHHLLSPIHAVINPNPPSNNSFFPQVRVWTYDGGADVHGAFALSGEPISTPIQATYGAPPAAPETTASQIAKINIRKRLFQKEYLEYWNGTAGATGTGRPVDALIAPLAPSAAARPGCYPHYGYTVFVNLLDYTAATIPVTVADKEVDVVDHSFQPLNEMDRKVFESCKCSPLHSSSSARRVSSAHD